MEWQKWLALRDVETSKKNDIFASQPRIAEYPWWLEIWWEGRM